MVVLKDGPNYPLTRRRLTKPPEGTGPSPKVALPSYSALALEVPSSAADPGERYRVVAQNETDFEQIAILDRAHSPIYWHPDFTGIYVLVDLVSREFTIEVGSDPKNVTIYRVLCKVTDPEAALHDTNELSIAKRLMLYFSRQEQSVSVGGGGGDTAVIQSVGSVRQMLQDDPPDVPGITVTLIDIYPNTYAMPDVEDHAYARRVADLDWELRNLTLWPNDRVTAAIWTSAGAEEGRAIRDALEAYLIEIGSTLVFRGDEQVGSWWQRFTFQVKRAFSSEIVQSHLAEAELRLRLELIDKAAADVSKVKAEAAAELIKSIDKVEHVVVIVGQVVVVKHNGKMLVRSLPPLLASKIENNFELLSNPEEVMRMLSCMTNETVAASGAPPELEAGD